MMPRLFLPVLALLAAGASAHAATPTSAIALWDGRTFSDWELIAAPATDITTVCSAQPDGVLAVTGKPVGYVVTKTAYENYRLHVEWRWSAAPANGGILLHVSSGPKDRQWPLCFQVQLKHTRAGDVLPMAGAKLAELPAPTATQVDRKTEGSEKPPGEWNVCDIVCRGATIECTVNGVPQNRVTNCTPAAGTIGFQLEGAPFELRHLRLAPLD